MKNQKMDDKSDVTSHSHFAMLHKSYQYIKKLSKIVEAEKEETVCFETRKEIIEVIDRTIRKIEELLSEDANSLRLIAMKITMFYERSKVLMSLGDEDLSRKTLTTALQIMNDFVSEAEIIFLAFRLINHYAYILTKRNEFEESRKILEFGETIYNIAKSKSKVIKFFTSDDLFVPEDVPTAAPETSCKLERLVTNNLQMLSIVYNKQELHDKFATYHHQVLRRQLDMKDEDVTMWALKAARLASYFLSKNRFVEARHHLTAAIYVLDEYEKDLQANCNIEKLDDFKRKYADVAKCWVKYGLFLFSVSKTNMVAQFCCEPNQILDKLWTTPFKNIEGDSSSVEAPKFPSSSEITKNISSRDSQHGRTRLPTADPISSVLITSDLTESGGKVPGNENIDNSAHFSSSDSEHPRPYLMFGSLPNLSESENEVGAALLETTAQARALFLHTHSWLKKVKTYYNLNDYPMEYVNVVLDLSELYRYLAFYEEEIESQYAVQKLRADALETLSTVLREIRPQCYISVSIELLRELAEVQLEMMGLNLRRIYAAREAISSEPSESILQKMDALADVHSRLEQFRDNFSHTDDAEKKSGSRNATPEHLTEFAV